MGPRIHPSEIIAITDEDLARGQRSGSESSDDDEDLDNEQSWDDFAEDTIAQQTCFSLFEDKIFSSVTETLAYDFSNHGFDLGQTCSRLTLDFHQRIRLINYIRKNKLSPADIASFTGEESFLSSNEYLLPAVENDPLLQFPFDDEWSDSDDDAAPKDVETDLSSAVRRIRVLEKKLAGAKQDFVDYRAFVGERLNTTHLVDATSDLSPAPTTARDDDSHYFESYGENDIHAIMIQDKVRTSTYAQFIMTNPALFRDAIVLDVGCGTGILSLFAAKSGAKRVIAVDASVIAEKAATIVKANGLDEIITVIRGKVEEITLPDDITYVDIIISEWMGYALLYESMLDSVLRARDRFLRPDGGVMAPSQCRMVLGLCQGSEIFKDRVGFWNDVYGFDLSTMANDSYNEAITDIVGPETMVSKPYVIKDLHLGSIVPHHLDFASSFTLVSTAERRTTVRAFVLYFDAFFTNTGEPVPPDVKVHIVKEGDVALAEVWPVGGKPAPKRRASLGDGIKAKPKTISFSTGPESVPTHWKQTIFLLREPITVDEGSVVVGEFHCRKCETNSRELEVEIHYSVKENAEASPDKLRIQIFKVR